MPNRWSYDRGRGEEENWACITLVKVVLLGSTSCVLWLGIHDSRYCFIEPLVMVGVSVLDDMERLLKNVDDREVITFEARNDSRYLCDRTKHVKLALKAWRETTLQT